MILVIQWNSIERLALQAVAVFLRNIEKGDERLSHIMGCLNADMSHWPIGLSPP